MFKDERKRIYLNPEGAEKGSESIKLETQVRITESGAERLDSFPWEDV